VTYPLNRDTTPRQADLVYGPNGVPLDDPAETFHEASKNQPVWGARQAMGARLLEANEQLLATVRRPGLRHSQRARLSLPLSDELNVPLSTLLRRRRSSRAFCGQSLTVAEIATLLYHAYGSVSPRGYRPTPSGGALYPLELYVGTPSTQGIEAGLYHYDALRHELEIVNPNVGLPQLAEATVAPEVIENAALYVAVTCVFWRSRFKYGQRGYRYCLLEAGHLMQNLLVAAEALELGAVPLGGFLDNRLSRLLEIDGVDEAPLYVAAIGRLE
jgi:SagB-type dehydrogenase family enzyme